MKKIYRAIPPTLRRKIGGLLPNSFRRNLVFDLVDTYIVSYPKAGRTWLRMLLGYIINKHYGLNLPVAQLTEVHQITKSLQNCQIIKFTHDNNPHLIPFDSITNSKVQYKDKNIIFLVRDPRDILVSYHKHYMYRQKSQSDFEELTLEELTFRKIGGIKNIINFYNSWIQAGSTVKNFEIIRYEDLKQNTVQVLKKLLEVIDINPSPGVIKEAISFCSFENLKGLEQDGLLNPKRYGIRNNNKSLKTRSGKIGSHKNEFSKEALEIVNKLIVSDLDKRFGYS